MRMTSLLTRRAVAGAGLSVAAVAAVTVAPVVGSEPASQASAAPYYVMTYDDWSELDPIQVRVKVVRPFGRDFTQIEEVHPGQQVGSYFAGITVQPQVAYVPPGYCYRIRVGESVTAVCLDEKDYEDDVPVILGQVDDTFLYVWRADKPDTTPPFGD